MAGLVKTFKDLENKANLNHKLLQYSMCARTKGYGKIGRRIRTSEHLFLSKL